MISVFLSLTYCAVCAGPEPGDIFREFTHNYDKSPGSHFSELDPECKREFEEGSSFHNKPRMVPKELDIDLEGAIKAEMSVEYWGGHIGTSEQKFKVNGHDWIYVPQPQGTPTDPETYYRTVLGASVAIPLEQLKHGVNAFQFTCGAQIRYGFDWGMYWIYSFTVRVYYDKSKPHPDGRIISPVSGDAIRESPELVAETSSANSVIRQVDFIGYYEDFDWEGDGIYRQWHYQTRYGILHKHIGISTTVPYKLIWDTAWVPDQDQPIRIMAKITDGNGICTMTPAVDNLSLARQDRSIRMYKPHEVPERFGVRVGNRMTCKIHVPDDLSNARDARLILSTWSADHADEIGLNDRILVERIGVVHNYSYDAIPVPLEIINRGINTFHIFANTEHHAAEVNWPGPVLMIEFR